MAAAMRDAQQRLAAMQLRREAAEGSGLGGESPAAGGAAARDAGAHFSPRSNVGADARALIVQVGVQTYQRTRSKGFERL